MNKATKIGLALIALSIVISVTVIVAGSVDADQQVGDFVLSDDGTVALQYTGAGGSVSIPDGVTTISDGIFMNNNYIYSIDMPNSVSSLGSGFASGCSQLQSVSLSSNLSSIPANAFRECSGLVSISLPSVSSIGENAFYGCASLSSISIPASVTSISLSAFDACDNLSQISVSSGNSNYSSYDGCLYNAAGSRLILVPGGKESVQFADTCSTIGSGAFSEAYYVTEVTIPASITTIEDQPGWHPSVIYGYADSAAETFAKNNGIPFIVIGPGPSPEPEPTPTPDPEPGPVTPGEGDVVNPDGTITKADGTVVEAATGRIVRVGTGRTGSSHTKDNTPGTADGVNPVYFLCFGVFLAGAGTLVYTRIRKTRYLKNKK